MTSALAIETRALTRHFDSRVVVDALHLQVPTGSICGFLGPNGAGKTTTIRLLLGLLNPTAGTILINGEVLHRDRPEHRRWTGALIESPSLYPNLTGRENLEVFRRLLNVSPVRVDEVLGLVQLSADADRLVRTYSLGMRQRLGLALALLGDPKLLILDEPANGLDPAAVRDLRDLMQRLKQQRGLTVFLSSHLLAEVEQIADYIAILDKGRLLFQGTLASLQSKHRRSIIVRVDHGAEAQNILQSHGWTARETADGTLSVNLSKTTDAATINAELVTAGIAVYHLSQEQLNLESIFLSATTVALEGIRS